MDANKFSEIIRARLKKLGRSQHRLALDNNLPQDAIRSVLVGHTPRLDRAAKICEALGLIFYVGPPRDQEEPAASHTVGQVAEEVELYRAPGQSPVSDRRLAEVLAWVVEEWDRINEPARESWLLRFRAAYPEWGGRTTTQGGGVAGLAHHRRPRST